MKKIIHGLLCKLKIINIAESDLYLGMTDDEECESEENEATPPKKQCINKKGNQTEMFV